MTDFTVTMNEFLPLREVVFQTLRQAILKGELKPGERLMEVALAERLGVSRTPIREAMRKLELEGLVVMVPRKGAQVASITEKDLTDTPAFVSGGKIMILYAIVSGWRPGQTVEVEYKNIHARGIVIARSVDADTGAGAWKCEMLVELNS